MPFLLNAEAARQALTRLTRLARRREQGVAWLEDILDRDPATLAVIALEVAVETGDPMGQLLARWIEKRMSPPT